MDETAGFPRLFISFTLLFALLLLSVPLSAQRSTASEGTPESRDAVNGGEVERDTPELVQRREMWFLMPRLVPGKSSADLLRQANEYKLSQRKIRIEMERTRRAMTASTSLAIPSATVPVGTGSTVWRALGPTPIVHDSTDGQNYGNSAGRVSAIAVDQADATGATVYVGGAYGGVWKSTNANAVSLSSVTWTPILDDQATLAVGAIAVNGNTILVGTGEAKSAVDSYYGMGILRSTDGGATWTLIQTADGGVTRIAGLGFGHIVFSKDNPSVVVATAIGTGLSVGLGALTGNFPRGIFYSLDGGASWHSVTVTEGSVTFQASTAGLVYNVGQHKFYAAVRYHGVYSSSDGATWTRTTGQPAGVSLTSCPSTFTGVVPNSCPFWRGELAARPDKDEMYTWFANDSYTSEGVFKSTDGGATWTALNMKPADTCDDTGGVGGKPTCSTYQLFYNMAMAAVPNKADADPNATDVYIASGNIFKCTINGAHPTCGTSGTAYALANEPYEFMDLTHVYVGACFGVAKVHPDQHAIAYSNTLPNIVYFGHDGGVTRSLNGPGLNTQSCSSVTLPFDNLSDNIGSMTQFIWATPDPADPTGALAGAQDNGTSATGATIRSNHGISGQQFFEMMSGDGGHTEIRKDVTPNYWYQSFTDATINLCTFGQSCGYTQFLASTYIDNTASSGENLGGDESAFYAPFMLDPQSLTHLLVGTCRVWRGSSNSPYGGQAISPNLNDGSTLKCGKTDSSGNSLPKIQALAMGGPVTGSGSQVVYAAFDDGEIWRTFAADNGAAAGNWVNVTPPTSLNWGTSAAGFAFAISSLAVDTTDTTGKTVYATVQGFGANHVLRSTDGGATWSGIAGPGLSGGLPDAPVNSVAIDPDDNTVIYVGSDVGVFVTTNGGATWTEVGPTEPGGASTGYLPNTVVTHVAVSKAGGIRQLVASTYGRGVWAATLASGGTITFSPGSHGFGSIATGTTANFSFTVTNSGGAALTVSSVGFSGTGSAAYSQTNNCVGALAASATCTVNVTFSPVAAASYPAKLVLTDSTATTYTATLSGVGTAPAVTLSPTSLAFGNQTVNVASAAQTVTVTNSGTGTLNISSIASNLPVFALSGNCITTTQLAPAASCSLNVVFTPTLQQPYSGTITVTDDVAPGTQTIAVTGTGTPPAPNVVFNPTSATFGNITVGASSTLLVGVSNNGTLNLVISTVAITPTGTPFTIAPAGSNTCNGATVTPGSGCSLTLTFTPSAVGAANAQLVVNSNVPSGTSTLSISGAGATAASLAASQPSTYRTPISTTQSQTVTLTNNGGTTASSLSIATPAGANASAFAITTNNCGTSLGVSQNCTFVVTFTAPAAAATNLAASIAISASSGAGTTNATVNLAGVAEDFQAPTGVVHGGSGSSATVTAGSSAQFDIAVAPSTTSGTFSSLVSFSCSGLPSQALCSFSPSTVTPGAVAGQTTLTISTVAATGTAPRSSGPLALMIFGLLMPGAVLAIPRKRRAKWMLAIALGLCAVSILSMAACGGGGGGTSGGGGGGGTIHNAGTPKGTYAITVTATSGVLAHTTTVNLTVQ